MREMKDSGVEWIETIPSNWQVKPLKSIATFSKGLPITKADLTETGMPVVSYGQIHSKKNKGTHLIDELIRYVPASYIESNPLALGKTGDLFFADTSEDFDGIGNAVLIDWDEPVFAGYHTIIVRPSDSGKYLAYLIQTDGWRSQLRALASGIKVFSVTQSMLRRTSVILPPNDEQQAIASYLDRRCATIDTLIANQQQQIEKLKQYKQAVITEAVTRGLDPNVQMKDSGVEWIGAVPEHWELHRIAYLYEERKEPGADDLPLLQVSINTGVSDHEMAEDEQDRVFIRMEDKTKYKRVYPGDLTYNMMRAWQGAFGAVRVNGMVSPAYVVAKPRGNASIDTRYFEALLRTHSATEEMHRYSHGIMDFRLRLYWPEFRNIRVCLPPFEEQQRIAAFIDEKSAQIDTLISVKQQKIDKLTQYKKSLIYEVVTGKQEV